jgi:hypothetical protein
MSASLHLAHWTVPLIRAECSKAYREYIKRRTKQYQDWFAAHPESKAPDHSYKAKDMATALPSGWSGVGDLLPGGERHLHYRSGKSSQILALGLLGAGARLDPSLDWLFRGLGPVRSPAARPPKLVFDRRNGVRRRLDLRLAGLPLPHRGPRRRANSQLAEDELVCRWHAGQPLVEIGNGLGLTLGQVRGMVKRLRATGVAVPYRTPQRRAPRGGDGIDELRRRVES